MSQNQIELVQIATGSMRVLWDAPIEMDDGTVLRADVFLPEKDGKYPVIIALGPYAKGLAFQDGYKSSWDRMTTAYPEILQGTTAKFANWELVIPKSGPPMAMCASVSMDAAPGAARKARHILPARDQRLSRLHRMGGGAALEQWQSRHQRHLVLCHQPVARRVASTAPSGGDLCMGRRG
jgi:hypothetical protein